jgi:hypothetical protein
MIDVTVVTISGISLGHLKLHKHHSLGTLNIFAFYNNYDLTHENLNKLYHSTLSQCSIRLPEFGATQSQLSHLPRQGRYSADAAEGRAGHHSVLLLPPQPAAASELPLLLLLQVFLLSSISFCHGLENTWIRRRKNLDSLLFYSLLKSFNCCFSST